MNKFLFILFIIFLFIIGVLALILYKDELSNIFQKKQSPTPQLQSKTQIFKGKITRIISLDNRLQIDLDTETPQILIAKDRGIAKINKTGQVERLLRANDLLVGNTIEVKFEGGEIVLINVYEN